MECWISCLQGLLPWNALPRLKLPRWLKLLRLMIVRLWEI